MSEQKALDYHNKRWAFSPEKIDDDKLPFVLEISRGMTPYFRLRKNGSPLQAADFVLTKRQLSISVDPFEIIIQKRDEGGKFVHTIKTRSAEK